MASPEQDLIEEALQDFQHRLHSSLPQTRLRHFTDFFDDEAEMKEVGRCVTIQVSKNFMDSVSALGVGPDKIGDLVKELCLKIQEWIDDCIAKNRENKTECKSFLKKRMVSICDNFKSSVDAKLVLNPEMDVEAMGKLLEQAKNRGLDYFEYCWNHGNVNFFVKQKKKLNIKLNKLQQKMFDKNRQGRTSENQNQVEGEINGNTNTTSVALPVSSEVTDAVRIKVEVVQHCENESESNFEPDSTITATPQKPELPKRIQFTDKAKPTSLLLTGNGMKRQELEEDPISGNLSTASTSKRPRLSVSETPIPGSSVAPAGTGIGTEDPLIFRLASNLISVGTRVSGDKFGMLKDQSINPAVAVDGNGQLVLGVEALKHPDCCLLEDCLTSSGRKKISFKIGEEMVNQEVHLEFLLGVLLKTMKDSAESYLKKSFRTAIITVPIWFCSTQRLQTRDAAYIAGFDVAHLIDQETVALYAYHTWPKSNPSEERKGDILVLAENFGIVNGVLYRNLEMRSDEYRRVENSSERMQKIKSIYSSLKRNQCDSQVKTVVFVTDSSDWRKCFRNFASTSGFKCSDYPGTPQLFGGSIFCEKTMEEVRATIIQYLPFKLSLYGVDEPNKWLTEPLKCQVPLKDFWKPSNPRIVQESVRSGEMVPVGEVEFKGRENYSEDCYRKALRSSMLILNFKTDSEAIVTLERMDVEKLEGKRRGSDVLLAGDFSWITPGLKEEEWVKLRRLVHSIGQ